MKKIYRKNVKNFSKKLKNQKILKFKRNHIKKNFALVILKKKKTFLEVKNYF